LAKESDGAETEGPKQKKVFSVVQSSKIDYVPTAKKTFTQRRSGGG
jgi:hypothetical protein